MKHPRTLIALTAALLAAPGCGSGTELPELVLLVSVDTLRADHLGFLGDADADTPHLDAFAAEGVVFQQAFAPSSFTVPSVTTMLTGFYPEQNAVYSNEHVLPEAVPTLAAHVGRRGYESGAVVSNFVLRGETGLARDFKLFDDRFPERESARGLPERTAEDTTAHALELLDRLQQDAGGPLFLWVHYQDPHGPYTPSPELRERYLAEERERPGGERELELGPDHRGLGALPDYQSVDDRREVAFYRAGYRAEITATDQAIGALLEGVKQRVDWERTLAVFTADHGEALGERDYWFAHGEYLDPPLTRVPLVFKLPGLEPGRREDVAGLVDLVPTLLPRLGLRPEEELPGRDLLAHGAEGRDSELYLSSLLGSTRPRVGLVREGHLYVATQRGPGDISEELFALDAVGQDVAGESGDLLERMRERLGSLRPELTALGEERKQTLSESDRAAMRALGYGPGHDE